MTQPIDKEGLATIASANAQAALATGDTPEAQKFSVEAANLFLAEMRRAKDEESGHLLGFLAATQFYRGGHYVKAAQVAQGIAPAKLPANTQHLWLGFLRDVKDRAAADYVDRTRKEAVALFDAGAYEKVLALLAEHPFVYSPYHLAMVRAACCERLGKFRPAVNFVRKAAQYEPTSPETLMKFARFTISSARVGHIAQAWEYVSAQLDLFPNPVSKAIASLLSNHMARRTDGQEKAARVAEQVRFFREARDEFGSLSDAQKAHPLIKEVMQWGYKALALLRLSEGKRDEAIAICEEAVAAAPEMASPWTLTAIVTNDNPEKSVPAWRKAISLAEPSFFPYASMTFHAYEAGSFAEAHEMAIEALKRCPDRYPQMQSMLLQLSAMSLAHLNGPVPEVGHQLLEAMALWPEDETAHENYQYFLTQQRQKAQEPEKTRWRVPNVFGVLTETTQSEWSTRSSNPDLSCIPDMSERARVTG
jgi:tetratricopeptide (TPR) repeat protein